MSKINQVIQGGGEVHIFKCYCGEDSFLEFTGRKEDDEIYAQITIHPTRLGKRLKLAWKALRGLEFTASNSVIIDGKDLPKLIKALQSYATQINKTNGGGE